MLYNLFENRDFVSVFAVALLAEGVDRNWSYLEYEGHKPWSPSSRRAWIEMMSCQRLCILLVVALLAEGVDRNFLLRFLFLCPLRVALLAEGVDRNHVLKYISSVSSVSPSSRRAWIEISYCASCFCVRSASPSSRRAWIEIMS